MKKIILSACMIVAACAGLTVGCATGTHILTGKQFPTLKPEQVTLYQIPPPKFEIVGIVNAQSPGRYQHNMDDAIDALKQQAARMGANGIILGNVNPGSESTGVGVGSAYGNGTAFSGSSVAVSSSGIQLSGQAIHVSQ